MIIKDIKFEIEIIHKNNKNMYLRVKDNKIVVTCPKTMTDEKVLLFIEDRKDWIHKQYLNQIERTSKIDVVDNKVYIFGKRYEVKYHPLISTVLFSDALYIGGKNKKVIRKNYDDFCEKLLSQVVHQFNDKWSVCLNKYPCITYKKMKSRWGVCYPKENRIVLNINLVHYEYAAIESVLVHEYMHFFVPNHSTKYYDLLLKYMPDYRQRQKLLK